ncbi:MAG: excinuclease ABC subunit UvrC [Leptospirales bacterium]|nr:excinuclease ABC subunit UvrC [Leptospirales bacterium]
MSAAEIAQAVHRSPTTPGCYIWKDEAGEILYVGKAVNLRARLRNYLRPEAYKTELLMERARNLEWITTETSREALILEANLVKKYQPRFNVRLKDDKRYPYLCLSTSEMYPQIYITRSVRDDGNAYFGPYTDVGATRNTLALIHKIFPIRKVRQTLPLARPRRPCMNFHIGRCLGPCQGNVPVEEYAKLIEQIKLFLEGRTEILETLVGKRMEEFSEKMEYEKAAMFRDVLANIRRATERQIVLDPGSGDEDLVALASRDDDGQMVVFEMREGKLIGRKSFPLKGMLNSDPEEIFESFIRDYYLSSTIRPARIHMPQKLKSARELEEALQVNEREVNLTVPKKPHLKSLLNLAQKNAELLLRERLLAARVKDRSRGLEELKEMLGLADVPSVMECYDISHLQGTHTVASGVCFVDGEPSRKDYRHYKIKTVDGIDDPASMEEVISRRLQRLLAEDRALPDLILIDGGVTQLDAACRAANALGCNQQIIAIAKQREEIYFPGESTPRHFDPASPGMLILRHMRDEAHRFGITHHRGRRNQAVLRHLIQEIPDIGASRVRALLKHFTETPIEDASEDDLKRVPGIGPVLANKIREFLLAGSARS